MSIAIAVDGSTAGRAYEVSVGTPVVLRLSSSLPGELSLVLDGYDDVRGELDAADGVTQVAFTASRRGSFPLLVEETGQRVGTLTVR